MRYSHLFFQFDCELKCVLSDVVWIVFIGQANDILSPFDLKEASQSVINALYLNGKRHLDVWVAMGVGAYIEYVA